MSRATATSAQASSSRSPRSPRSPGPGNSSTPPSAPGSDEPSFHATLGTTLGAGLIAAGAASVPAALRAHEGGAATHTLAILVLSTGALAPLAVLVALAFQRARLGLRVLVGARPAHLVVGALAWSGAELFLLAIFARILRANTHHHGLAGVTFAGFAVVSGLSLALFVARGVRLLDRITPSGERITLTFGALALVALVVAGARVGGTLDLPLARAVVDGMALFGAAALTSSSTARLRSSLALTGPFALLVVGCAVLACHLDPSAGAALVAQAPLHAWFVNAVGIGPL